MALLLQANGAVCQSYGSKIGFRPHADNFADTIRQWFESHPAAHAVGEAANERLQDAWKNLIIEPLSEAILADGVDR